MSENPIEGLFRGVFNSIAGGYDKYALYIGESEQLHTHKYLSMKNNCSKSRITDFGWITRKAYIHL
jgi:hypothetical protein